MSTSKRIIRFLVLLLTVGACAKDKDAEPSYPLTFVGEQYVVKTEARVFTSAGEQQLTEEHKSLLASSSFFDPADWVGKGNPFLVLQTDSTAIFTEAPTVIYTYKRTGDDWLFTSNNSVDWHSDFPTPAPSRLYVHNYEFIKIPVPGGFRLQSKEFRMAEGSTRTIRVPITVVLTARISEHERSVSVNRVANKLKSDFEAELLQTLPDTDIVIVKEFELVCKVETFHY